MLQKLAVPHLVKKFSVFHGRLKFTTSCQMSLFWTRWIYISTSSHRTLRSILIFPPIYACVFYVTLFLANKGCGRYVMLFNVGQSVTHSYHYNARGCRNVIFLYVLRKIESWTKILEFCLIMVWTSPPSWFDVYVYEVTYSLISTDLQEKLRSVGMCSTNTSFV